MIIEWIRRRQGGKGGREGRRREEGREGEERERTGHLATQSLKVTKMKKPLRSLATDIHTGLFFQDKFLHPIGEKGNISPSRGV